MSLDGKVVLITGGAGFIGSNLAEGVSRAGAARILVLDDMTTGRKSNLDGIPNVEITRGTVSSRFDIVPLVAQSDIVFHMATRNITSSTINPQADFETNVVGAFNVLRCAANSRHVRGSPSRIVVASSSAVYGNARTIPTPETSTLMPLVPYSASKICVETYARMFHSFYGLPVTILRYTNVYGPRQTGPDDVCYGERHNVVTKLVLSALRGDHFNIYGDGSQTRDFVYVTDVTDATIRAVLLGDANQGHAINIGSGIERTISGLVDAVSACAGKDMGTPPHVEARDVDMIHRRCLDVSKAEVLLGWKPSTTLAEGVKRTYLWFRRWAGQG